MATKNKDVVELCLLFLGLAGCNPLLKKTPLLNLILKLIYVSVTVFLFGLVVLNFIVPTFTIELAFRNVESVGAFLQVLILK